jgi:hypothetical protein
MKPNKGELATLLVLSVFIRVHLWPIGFGLLEGDEIKIRCATLGLRHILSAFFFLAILAPLREIPFSGHADSTQNIIRFPAKEQRRKEEFTEGLPPPRQMSSSGFQPGIEFPSEFVNGRLGESGSFAFLADSPPCQIVESG